MKEFKPIDKLSELTEMLGAYNPIIHQKNEEGYDWLDENSFCIEVPNPNGGESLIIEADCWEFTVFYSYYHTHFCAEEGMYGAMCITISDILNSKLGTAAIFCGSENKWMSSTMIERENTSLPIEEIFQHTFNHSKSADKLRINGGEARFIFWDSSFNKTIKI